MNSTSDSSVSDRHEIASFLDDAIAALGAKERDALILRFYQDKSLREVGTVLGISEDAAAQRISRALRHLRLWLGHRGLATTEGGLALFLPSQLSTSTPSGLISALSKSALNPVTASQSSSQISCNIVQKLAMGKLKAVASLLVAGALIICVVADCACKALAKFELANSMKNAPTGTLALQRMPAIEAVLLKTLDTRDSGVFCASLSADGHRALTGGGGALGEFPANDASFSLWNIDTGKLLRRLRGHAGRIVSIAFLHDQHRAVSASADGTARLWDLDTGRQLRELDVHLPIAAMSVSPNGEFAAIGARLLRGREYASIADDGAPRLRIWNLQNGDALEQSFDDVRQGVAQISYAPDGHLAAVLDSNPQQIRIWDSQLHNTVRFTAAGSIITCIAFSPDGRRLVGGYQDGHLRAWDASTGVELGNWPAQRGGVFALAFAPDGKTVISAGGAFYRDLQGLSYWTDCALYLRDAQSGRKMARMSNNSTPVYSLSFGAEGRVLLSAGGERVGVWEIADSMPRPSGFASWAGLRGKP